MTQRTWAAVDVYLDQRIVRPDDALSASLAASRAAGLPAIAVTAAQRK